MPVVTKTVTVLKCSQCGYEWPRKARKNPLRCANPKCQSPNWNVTTMASEPKLAEAEGLR
jgi:predicted Zn-ribbon and HTH transcriptional regulator